jgi:hypothetical protein
MAWRLYQSDLILALYAGLIKSSIHQRPANSTLFSGSYRQRAYDCDRRRRKPVQKDTPEDPSFSFCQDTPRIFWIAENHFDKSNSMFLGGLL